MYCYSAQIEAKSLSQINVGKESLETDFIIEHHDLSNKENLPSIIFLYIDNESIKFTWTQCINAQFIKIKWMQLTHSMQVLLVKVGEWVSKVNKCFTKKRLHAPLKKATIKRFHLPSKNYVERINMITVLKYYCGISILCFFTKWTQTFNQRIPSLIQLSSFATFSSYTKQRYSIYSQCYDLSFTKLNSVYLQCPTPISLNASKKQTQIFASRFDTSHAFTHEIALLRAMHACKSS